MLLNSKYYANNFLHLHSYEIKDNYLKLKIINENKLFINSIVVIFNDEKYNSDINTNDTVIYVEIKISNNGLVKAPFIYSYFLNNKEILLDYTSNCEYLLSPKSINSLGDEKYLYVKKMVKHNKCKKENVKCVANKMDTYWHCTCGEVNLNCQDTCDKCGIKKDDLFSTNIDTQIEGKINRKGLKINYELFIWMFLIFVFQFFIVGVVFKGDLLFSNQLINEPINIFNRFVIVLVPIFSVGTIYARKRYNRVLENAFDTLRVLIVLYLNIFINAAFVKSSYNFFLVIAFNALFIFYYIYLIVNKINHKFHFAYLGIISALLISTLVQFGINVKYKMQINKNGVLLTCNVNQSTYKVPEKINGNKVYEVIFNANYDYSKIKKIVLPNTVNKIDIFSTMVLPSLEKIEISSDNPYFTVRNDILFKKNRDEVVLCPNTLTEITIDWENVKSESFFDCESLETVNFTNDVKVIEENAFKYCVSLSNLNFMNGSQIKEIKTTAFDTCLSLKNVVIPDSLEIMGRAIFKDCINIESIQVPFFGINKSGVNENESNLNYSVYPFDYGYNWVNASLKFKKLKKYVVTSQKVINNYTFYLCPCEEIVLNDIEGDLGYQCFFGCNNLKSFTVPNGIKNIDNNCFEQCTSLETITIPNTIEKINSNAFLDCINLSNVNYDGNMKNICIEETGNESMLKIVSY